MKARKLIDGSIVEELKEPVSLVIETKCPSKWKIVDMETGQAYIGTDKNKKFQYWQAIDNDSCLLYTSPSPRDRQKSRMPASA